MKEEISEILDEVHNLNIRTVSLEKQVISAEAIKQEFLDQTEISMEKVSKMISLSVYKAKHEIENDIAKLSYNIHAVARELEDLSDRIAEMEPLHESNRHLGEGLDEIMSYTLEDAQEDAIRDLQSGKMIDDTTTTSSKTTTRKHAVKNPCLEIDLLSDGIISKRTIIEKTGVGVPKYAWKGKKRKGKGTPGPMGGTYYG